MISLVRNNQIIEEPQSVPKSWIDPDTNKSYSNFYNLSIDDLFSLGWKEVIDEPLSYDSFFESLDITSWYYDIDNDIVTRDYSIVYHDIGEIKWNMLLQLEETKSFIQQGGIIWNDGETDWQVDTRESSKNKISDERSAADTEIRNESQDLFQFMNGFKIITNEEVISISNLVRSHYLSCYPIVASFQQQIMNPSVTVEDLKLIKTQIENSDNWPDILLQNS